MDAARAATLLEEVAARPSVVNMARAARELEPHRERLSRARMRLSCLATFTFDPIRPALELQALRSGLGLTVDVGPYRQIEQGLIDPQSQVSRFSPDVVLIAARLKDICPAVYDSFNSIGADQARKLVGEWHERLSGALTAFRSRSKATVLVQGYERPVSPALGLADEGPESQRAVIDSANEELGHVVQRIGNGHWMDYDGLVARHGRAKWADARMAYYARMAVAPEHVWALAGFYVRHLRALTGLTRKVLVLDADNTLWGGVVGDVGLEGIAVGEDYPGNAFLAFQKKVLDLHRRGVLLCINSKNEPGSVEAVLDRNPAMVLRREHFAALRVNWKEKPENLRSMAEELNLGMDSFVFIDDHPVECELMRLALPEVMTICGPKEPAELPGLIDSLDCFDQFHISEEDRARGALYRAEADRRYLRTAALDLPSFYRQLEMTMTLRVNQPGDAGRAAQMAARTNQFNMHTLRYGEDDIRRFMASDEHLVVTLVLKDRFGDNGVVGLAVIRRGAKEWTLHVFLMSCRVLGRTVEQCFLKWIAARAKKAGATRLVGEFVATAKNKPFEGFYESCGFQRLPAADGPATWALTLGTAETEMPDWMRIIESDSPGAA